MCTDTEDTSTTGTRHENRGELQATKAGKVDELKNILEIRRTKNTGGIHENAPQGPRSDAKK